MRLAGKILLIVALLCCGIILRTGTLVAEAAGRRVQPTPPLPQVAAAFPARDARISLLKLRTGSHQTHTRVVLELSGPAEWSVERPGAGTLSILLPKVGLDVPIADVAIPNGSVRGVRTLVRAGGLEVQISTVGRSAEYRTLMLQSPDRLVVDVLLATRTSPDKSQDSLASAGARQSGAAPPERRAVPGTSAMDSRTSPKPSRDPAPPVNTFPSLANPASPIPPATLHLPLAGRDGPEEAAPSVEPAAPPSSSASRGRVNPRSANVSQGPSHGPSRGGQSLGDAIPPELSRLTVVLDPGHGGHDTGAIGPTGLMEKDVVLDLAHRLRRLLEERLRVRVLMTRTEDVFVPLAERTAIANRARADFFISLHVNGAEHRGAVGFETFFFAREPSDNDARASAQRENLVLETNGNAGKGQVSLLKTTLTDMAVTRDMKESSTLAELLLASLDGILRVENRGVKSGPFHVLATAAMPAVLVESAFITNPREERRLQRDDYRQRLAEAIYHAVAKYKTRYEQRIGMPFHSRPAVGS